MSKKNPKVVWKPIQNDKIKEIISKVPKDKNSFVSLKIEDFPELNIAPQSYRDKIIGVDVAVSGCPVENTNYYMCNLKRFDRENDRFFIDQDVFGFIIDSSTNYPYVSGCMVYHGNWDGRTEKLKPLSPGTPEHIFTLFRQAFSPASGNLSELPESELRAFEYINTVLQEEKQNNPDFISEVKE